MYVFAWWLHRASGLSSAPAGARSSCFQEGTARGRAINRRGGDVSRNVSMSPVMEIGRWIGGNTGQYGVARCAELYDIVAPAERHPQPPPSVPEAASTSYYVRRHRTSLIRCRLACGRYGYCLSTIILSREREWPKSRNPLPGWIRAIHLTSASDGGPDRIAPARAI